MLSDLMPNPLQSIRQDQLHQSDSETVAHDMGWQCGSTFAPLFPGRFEDVQQRTAKSDAENLTGSPGMLAALEAVVQPEGMKRCACGHVLRSPLEQQHGHCLECRIATVWPAREREEGGGGGQ